MPNSDPSHSPAAFSWPGKSLLLYDGECGVCSASVQWILSHERIHTLHFAPINSPLGQAVRRATELSDQIDSLVWIEKGEHTMRALVWSDAVLAVVSYVGGPWKVLALLRFVPARLRHAAYRLFASNRRWVAPSACLVPAVKVRQRFLQS